MLGRIRSVSMPSSYTRAGHAKRPSPLRSDSQRKSVAQGRSNPLQFAAVVGGDLNYDAPFQRAIELIGKRWTGSVVYALLPSPARFNQLLAGIPGISDRVLTERLRELEGEGLVERLVDPGPPVRVSYRLTERGGALKPVIASISDWAGNWPDRRRGRAGNLIAG